MRKSTMKTVAIAANDELNSGDVKILVLTIL